MDGGPPSSSDAHGACPWELSYSSTGTREATKARTPSLLSRRRRNLRLWLTRRNSRCRKIRDPRSRLGTLSAKSLLWRRSATGGRSSTPACSPQCYSSSSPQPSGKRVSEKPRDGPKKHLPTQPASVSCRWRSSAGKWTKVCISAKNISLLSH